MQKLRPVQLIALLAFLIALPLLVGAAYDKLNPQSVIIGDRFTPTYEQFKIDTYERLTDRDIRSSELWDDVKMRQSYEIIAAAHWNLVTQQTNRRLYMYGALAVVSLGCILFEWRTSGRQRQNHPNSKAEDSPQEPRRRRGIVIKPKEK